MVNLKNKSQFYIYFLFYSISLEFYKTSRFVVTNLITECLTDSKHRNVTTTSNKRVAWAVSYNRITVTYIEQYEAVQLKQAFKKWFKLMQA